MFWSDFDIRAMLASKMSCETFYSLLYSERDCTKLLLIPKLLEVSEYSEVIGDLSYRKILITDFVYFMEL